MASLVLNAGFSTELVYRPRDAAAASCSACFLRFFSAKV